MDDFTRRSSLARFGGVLLAGLGVAASGTDSSEGAGPAAVASGAVKCVLTPEQTEGPFYLAGEKVRRNIVGGRPGAPLTLRLQVVNASTCKPIPGAAMDVWHCDASGTYSGVEGNNGTFLRGIQMTGPHGVATFQTIYPGWYRGRTVHIHVKVHLGSNVVHTGQLYLPDGLTDAVYRGAPYSSRGPRDTRNRQDWIYRNGGSGSLMSAQRRGSGYVAAITMGVNRS
jgi:protocatechuate 3,4-dioxygenase beta subunit